MVETDCEIQFRTGMATLAGTSSREEWETAVGLLEAAAAAGHADALERRALLEWRGLGSGRGHHEALDSLILAAERGSQSAARQLILLAEDRFDPAESAEPPPGGWAALKPRISLGKRATAAAAPGRTLSSRPLVQAVPGLASAAECQWLIAAATPRLTRAGVYNSAAGDDPADPTGVDPGRTNSFALFDFVNADLVVDLIRMRIANKIGAPMNSLEIAQVLHYEVGQEFVAHCDYLDPELLRDEIARNGQRAATVILYLNEDFEGGETRFPRLGLDHRGSTGDALVFASIDPAGRPDPRTRHAGCPPTRGEKWVFSQWVRSRPIRRA